MDTATSDIRDIEFTPSHDGDSPVLSDLLGQVCEDEKISTVIADGAYDKRSCHKAIIEHHAMLIVPISKNGRLRKDGHPIARARNETLRATQYCGRAFWSRWMSYHSRNRVEAKMRSKMVYGERNAAGDPERQTAVIHIRVALMNRFNALRAAEIERLS